MAKETNNVTISTVMNKLVRNNKEAAAILSKYQKLPGQETMGTETNIANSATYPLLKSHSEKNNEKTKSSDDIKTLFPDAAIGEAILTASILTPNSYDDIALNYKYPTDFPMLDTVKKSVCNIIKEHINKHYKLEEKLKDIVKESLFEKGAYIECFIPEAALDDAINNYRDGNNSVNLLYSKDKSNSGAYVGPVALKDTSYSDYIKNLGKGNLSIVETITGNENSYGLKRKQKLESLSIKDRNKEMVLPLPIITDNVMALRNLSKDIKTLSKELRAGNLSYLSLDAYGNIQHTKRPTDDGGPETVEEEAVIDFLDIFSKNPDIVNNDKGTTNQDDTLLTIKNREDASRKSIGRPLCLKINTEAVIPIHSPYDKKDHIGYFVLLDENGKILDMSSEFDSTLQDPDDPTPVQIGTVDHNAFIAQGRRNTEAMTKDISSLDVNEELFTNIVHGMVSKKLKEGKFGDLASFNKQDNQLIYKMMFFRALHNRGTQMLFLPADEVAYFAYDFRGDGTGRSILEKTSFLYSLRAMLLMSTINATLTNAVNTEEISVELDENVTDVEAILAQIQEAILQNRATTFPIGVTNPVTLQSLITRSGYKFNVSSPRLPQVNISTSDTTRSVAVPDETIDEKLKDMLMLSMGITPELIKQASNDVEFATVANNRHILFNLRVKILRARTDELISSYVKKVIKNDEELREKIEKEIISNFKVLSTYIAKNINKLNQTKEDMAITERAFLVYVNKAMESLEENLKITLPKSELDDGGPVKKQMDSVFSNIDSTVDALFTSDILSSDFLGETIGNKSTLITSLVKTALKRKWVVENNAVPDLIDLVKPITPESDQSDNIFVSLIQDIQSVVKQFSTAYNVRKDLKEESNTIKKIDDEGVPNEYADSWGSGGGSYGDDSGGYDSGGEGEEDNNDGTGDEGDGDGGMDEGDGFDDYGSDEGDEGGSEGDGSDEGSEDDGGDSDTGDENEEDDNPTKGTDDEIDGWI